MVRLLRQNCQFHGFKGEDANDHLNKYLSIAQFMKQNGVSQDVINLNLFPFSLTHEAESWYYHLKTHYIHTWEEMFLKFLSKYFPYSRTVQLRKEILNFRQLPTESVFDAWERFKSCLRKCPDHRILLLNQILTFYNGITMIDQERFMWDAELYYNTTTDMSADYSETTFTSRERVEVLGKQTGYTTQSVQHNPGPGHSNSFYYSDSDEIDDDEPSEKIEDQKSIYHLSGSLTPSSDPVVASLSPSLTPTGYSDSLVEETDSLLSYIDDSFPEYETFYFDIKEKSSGSTTSHSNHSLPEYESFYFDDDHIKEKSSGSTTTHSDFSLPEYDSFIFDLSIDPLPLADRSDFYHEEFADELTHIISPPEYDRFYFDIEPDLGELTIFCEENISKDSTKELTSPELNDFPLLLSDCDSTFSEEFSKIDLLVSFPSENKDKIFDPGIFIIKRVQYKRFQFFPLDDFSNILVIGDFLLLTDPSAIETFLSFLSGNKDKVFDPGILLNNGIFSFTRKSPHLLIDNFLIDKCHFLRDDEKKVTEEPGKEGGDSSKDSKSNDQEDEDNVNSTNTVNSDSTNEVNVVGEKTSIELPDDLNMPELEDIVYSDDDEDVGAEADMNNLDTFMPVSHIITIRLHKDHPVEQIIEDLNSAPQTIRMTKNLEEHGSKLDRGYAGRAYTIQVTRSLDLVELPKGKRAIGNKWVFRNKKDERGIVIKNKARLVAQGYTQEEGIDYDEVFAPVARIETIRLFLAYASFKDFVVYQMNVNSAFLYGYTQEEGIDYDEVFAPLARIETIRLFLAYASFKDFVVYQMNVKSAFLYGKIDEEVYVCQPPGFEDPDFPDRVYKVEKGLYGLHQASRAWYEILSTYLLNNGFQRGKIDKTLFIRREKGDILLVQVYVDDIIFCSTKKSLCIEFEKMIHTKFLSTGVLVGELTFFRDLQTASTPMETQKPLLKDEDGEEVDATIKAKIVNGEVRLQALVDGKKIIITKASIRSDIQLNDEEGMDCLTNATIFEELTRMGYKKLSHKLTFYKAFFSPQWKFLIHTILQCLSAKTTAWNEFSSTMASAIICLAINQKFNFSKYIFESMVKNLDNADEDVYEERDDSLERSATTAIGLDAEQDKGNINKTQSKATPNEPSSPGTSLGGGTMRQETMGDIIA
ncbi:putative ribonuclease H-like domain-containing protein [Tanacetum coccineum]